MRPFVVDLCIKETEKRGIVIRIFCLSFQNYCNIKNMLKREHSYLLYFLHVGLDVEGLYRVSGFSDEIEMCRMIFERGIF